MQHHPATIEEQLILKAIKEECLWENLPKRLHATLSSKEEWHRRIVNYCVKKRLQWNTCFARKVCKEGEYYEDMMRYLRKNMALFPYHLAEYVCRVMRVSPFRYYCDMMFEVMKNEQPYDSIPNFSAADALRVTGIGRNEFIDIMNKCRSKKIMWKLNKSIAKDLLPTQPVDFTIESWWGVCLVNFTLEEFKKLSEEEMATIDKVCKEEVNAYILFDPDIIKGLCRRGLIYFDVPVYPDDRVKVSRLEGFVSNREQSYEDPIEELLYAVFVVSSENATVADLASTLQADLPQLQAAASFACRLGWAQKVIDPGSILRDSSARASIDTPLSIEDGSLPGFKSVNDCIRIQEDVFGMEHLRREDGSFHVAFVVDANITSYLMMGSVSPGLKSHAVTLYEAGKLGDASIADLCRDLCTLAGTKFEGELQEFANHASSLRCILECLRSGGISENENSVEICGERTEQPSCTSDVCSLSDKVSLPQSTEIMGPGKSDLHDHDYSQARSFSEGSPLHSLEQNFSTGLEHNISSGVNSNVDFYDDPATGKIQSMETPCLTRKKFCVDILRCESLAALAPATLERLFRRDYDIVVSMIPLPYSCTLPGPNGPTHFGPPSHSFMTPWMRLLLYSDVRSGPLSVVLMKGQCLRLLPTPLAGCEKALLWSWDGSAVGGLGGKFEGNLVKGGFLLHCLNSLLKHSAVLVQPLSSCDLDASGNIKFIDIPLPLKDSDGSLALIGEEFGLPAEEHRSLDLALSNMASILDLSTIGYIRFLRLCKERELTNFSDEYEQYEWVPLGIQFGVPLFSPELCSNICKRVVCSQLLQADSVTQHHGAMQVIRKRLHDVCSEYQATGHAGKLIYHREQSKDTSRHLMNYASGKWNPLLEPSSPICGPLSEHQRLKLVNRHRYKTEVLSFDGTILRSYALAPVCEAATRPIDESLPVNASKAETDDVDSKEVILPGVNLIFDGSELHVFDITACLQARQPAALIAEASNASASSFYKC